MLDHVGFTVSDLNKSKIFYVSALQPLGVTLILEVTPEHSSGGSHAGFGAPNKPFFWIGDDGEAGATVHVAFTSTTRAQVDSFYSAALSAGGTDNGAPGVRPHYHDNYYAAFVLDPDGNNIEAVCHTPP
jgi:catechol 2,3-dioxygenase-like lactoylglutathione lyase family enzyme